MYIDHPLKSSEFRRLGLEPLPLVLALPVLFLTHTDSGFYLPVPLEKWSFRESTPAKLQASLSNFLRFV